MTTITSLNFAPTHLGHQDERYYTDQDRADNWAPANVWSWLSCGKTSQYVTVSGGQIQAADDVSGNDRDWEKFSTESGLRYAASLNFPDQDWATDLPVLQALRSASSGTIELLSPLNATGEFYLAHAVFNSRGAGQRYMFGGATSGDAVRLRQDINNIEINIADAGLTQLASNGTVVADEFWLPMFLEIWRDSSNTLHVAVNMTEVGTDEEISGTFSISQFGGATWAGGSHWDDYLLEAWVATAAPTLQQRREIYNYLRVKWGF